MSPLAASHQYWFHRRGQTLRLASACLNSSYVEPSRDFRLLARGWRNLDGGKYVTVVPNGERKKEKKESRETDENGWTFQKFKSDDLIDVSRNFCIVIRIKKKTVLKFNCKNKNLFQPLLRFTRIFKHDIESSSNSRFFFANSILRCKKKKKFNPPFRNIRSVSNDRRAACELSQAHNKYAARIKCAGKRVMFAVRMIYINA